MPLPRSALREKL